MGVQEVEVDNNGTEAADFFYGKVNEKRMLWTGCFVRQSILSTFMDV